MRADLEKIVWAAECDPKRRAWKFVLLNLCHHANPEGEAYPSVATVMRETGYSNRAVADALTGLEELGIIRRTGGCGQRRRVSVYLLTGIFTNVHNLANGELSSHERGFNGELISVNGELSSKKGPFNGELISPNGELSSHRSILGSKSKLVSKLVSGAPNSELTSPFVDNSEKAGQNPPAEGSPPPHGPEPRQVAPSARNEAEGNRAGQDHERLLKTPGWKPKTDLDRRWCMYRCYTLGASRDEAEKFVRYNAIRRWTKCEYATVNDLAKQWVDKWREDEPDEWLAERKRRREQDVDKTLQ